MAYANLPGIFERKLDGNLQIVPTNSAPIVVVLGQAAQGDSDVLYQVIRTSDASRVYGKSGTLVRGMFEAATAGAINLRLYRIGATASVLSGIGAGLTVTTIAKDDSAGTDYKLFWDDSDQGATGFGRLRVYRVSDDELVYDNNPADPLSPVDLQEIETEGLFTAGTSGDIGAALVANAITLAAADAVSGASYTAGTDGLTLSRAKLYEELYDAYELLTDSDLDVVAPMDVYLDDLNVMDMNGVTISGLALASLSDYPTPGGAQDLLGKVFVEEVSGLNYFWWWYPSDPSAAVDATFTSDGGAQIVPSIGSAAAALDSTGTAITGSDFHEVNFAYQLADFCYTSSRDNTEMTGVIGVKAPTSFSLKNVAGWVGKLPTTATDANGNTVITTNGTGLLGNKFMSGRLTASSIPGHTVDGIDGLFDGGFIATDTGWLDDTQQSDDNQHLIDIGKYMSVVAAYPILSNPSRPTSYTASGAVTYGGFYSVLAPESAATNKQLRNLRLPFRINNSKLDLLAGQRFVTFHAKTRGIVVSDAPTASRPDSDYNRLSTVRQVKAAIDAVRRVAEPFLGEGLTGARISALDTAVDGVLKSLVRRGILQRYDSLVSATPTQRVAGQATAELVLVPAFELRQLTVVIALSAT
jgi:hypothetical protein